MNLDISSSRIMLPNLPNFDGFRTQNQLMGKINGGGPSVKIKGTGGNIKIYDNNYGDFGETIKPQSSFEKRQEKIIEKKLPLTNESFFFLTLIFCILLTYRLSSIVYFTLQMINPQESQTGVDKILFFSNIANGLGSHLAVNIFILTLDNLIYDKLLKYLSIVILTVILVVIFQSILYVIFIGYSQNLFKYSIENKDALIYTIIPLLVACICFYYWQRTHQISRKISEQEYQLLNLEKLKTTAELGALQARINPHFLYNSLNNIASLVHSDPDKAEEMTILLSKLFRYTTDRNDELFSSVADELEIVKTYLSIEQVRFGDRLKFTTKLESGLEKFQIPRLLLKPIVENAIKHGISKISGDGKIEVNIYEKSDNIILSVHDSGVLFPEEMASGYGLRSIQDKLRLIYGNDAALEIHNEPQYKSVVITIKKK